MHLKQKNTHSKILSISKKHIFLKFLENRKFFLINNKSKNQEPESKIDLSELLDEKNVKLTLSDILKDYRYFRKEYYLYRRDEYSLPDIEEKVPELPFNEKEMTLTKIIKYNFFSQEGKKSVAFRIFLLGFAFHVVALYCYFKYKYVVKVNEYLARNLEDQQIRMTRQEYDSLESNA